MVSRKQVILFLLLGVVLMSFALVGCLSFYFLHCMPSFPQPQVGRTYQFSEHGWKVYLTWREKLLFDISSSIFLISATLLVVYRLVFFYR